MNFFKYCLLISLPFCGCAGAAPKEKINELACPYVLSAEKDFPANWVALGKITTDRLQLREIGIIDGNAIEEKNEWLILAKECLQRT